MNQTTSDAPLEDIMVAMDVVDTLRHAEGVATRELDGEGRRERLLERLREMYRGQGIEVPDHVLQEGIDALEQERFQYQPVPSNWKTKVAHIWVNRSSWLKPVGVLALISSLFGGFHWFTDVLPEQRLRAEIPTQIERTLSEIKGLAKDKSILQQASETATLAKQALSRDNLDEAKVNLNQLSDVSQQLKQSYIIRVVSRPGIRSGVWRVPPGSPNGKNYYLIVEAVDASNHVVELNVLNQENNKRERKKIWGLRVNETTFARVAADKRDDGIIQNNKVGEKFRGYLAPKFSVPTTGATITEW